jgi:hypothetical protein
MKKLFLTILFFIGCVPVIAAAASGGLKDSLSEPAAIFFLGCGLVILAAAGRYLFTDKSKGLRE